MKLSDNYRWAKGQIRKKVKNHHDIISTLANCSAILKERFPKFFWVGFYFLRDDNLILGPFQGPPACVKLNLVKGVCADCAREKKPILVKNVNEYPGHVSCDSRSKSEVVIPLFNNNGELKAVLDIDSEKIGDFSEEDVKHLESIEEILRTIWN